MGLAEQARYCTHRLRAIQAAPPSATAPATTAVINPASSPALPPDEPVASSGVPATSGSSAMPPIDGSIVGVGVGVIVGVGVDVGVGVGPDS